MAIYHLTTKPLSRASGRSAVAAAAYRAGVRLVNARDGQEHDFRDRRGVVHAEIVLPAGVDAAWARDRQRLWDAAEAAEKRKDARTAREVEVALPCELTNAQRLELTRDLAAHIAARYGVAVDFAIHAPSTKGDQRNHHAHLLMATRCVGRDGLGEKADIELSDTALRAAGKPVGAEQVLALRQDWEQLTNRALARAGHEVTVDSRSHAGRGIRIEPTTHAGPTAGEMERKGKAPDRRRLDHEAAARNAALIREKPDQVLGIITGEQAVFDRRDIARALHRCIGEDAQEFQNALAAVMTSPALVQLQAERTDPRTGKIIPARYSTREMIDIEHGMAAAATSMHEAGDHGVAQKHVARAVAVQNADIQRSSGDAAAGLSQEQVHAIAHVTGPQRIAAVVGFAGAGKSTMLSAARGAWEAQGYRVYGAALAGKAAAGLRLSSGIPSRTLASWERSWAAGRGLLQRGDVFVLDEAGMVSARQMARLISTLEKCGAKAVLVGDHEQLQAIGAGSPFRAIVEQVGHVTLADVRRQREGWQRQATVDFASHRTAEALAAYNERGQVHFAADRDEARATLVRDYLADVSTRPEGTRAAMAHRRADVHDLNEEIRAGLRERGELAGELAYETTNGPRNLAAGDRIIFLENSSELGVKNGTLATLQEVAPGRLVARLDDGGETVTVDTGSYQALDYGYATTIHKNQGATVDRSFVLASQTMDRHLAYVAMSRHRNEARLYAGRDEFQDFRALARRLSRSAAKENAQDYDRDFAERRGIAEALGVRSGIDVTPQAVRPDARSIPPLVAAMRRPESMEQFRARREREITERQFAVWRAAAARVWRPGALDGAEAQVRRARESLEARQALNDTMRRRPECLGELLGSARLFGLAGEDNARQAARQAAHEATNALSQVAPDRIAKILAQVVAHEERARARESVEVPGVAPELVAEWTSARDLSELSPAAVAAARDVAAAARRRWPGLEAADIPAPAAQVIAAAQKVEHAMDTDERGMAWRYEQDIGLSR
ncbi:Ti-type conjugative transfer relaxase TraA [Xanthobacter agilis]|uniref:Ti-type conjugative transfer relaxase TraA n=1 Tax=Xanthobacter agilis TaxID=47492 RepID=UPI0037277B8F